MHPLQETDLTQDISIQFTRFSAFYSPLIATIAGGYLGVALARRFPARL